MRYLITRERDYPLCEIASCGTIATHGVFCETHARGLEANASRYVTMRGVDGGERPASETEHTGKPSREQALITSLERLIEQWREREKKLCRLADTAESAGNSLYARALSGQAQRIADQTDELEAVLSSLTREREP